jgi:hypothetical protein
MEISLRPGEALRIENEDGSVLTVSAPPGAELWEIRVDARRDPWWKCLIRAWREDRAARELAPFDERLLTDIGLGPHAGNPLATRVYNYRQQELRRISMARLGLM